MNLKLFIAIKVELDVSMMNYNVLIVYCT